MQPPSQRLYPAVVALFSVSLVVSNIIAVKLVGVFGLTLPAAVILFPLTYIFGDILTEVYGYARARQAIWTGFAANALAVAAIWIGGLLPPAAVWTAGVYGTTAEAEQAYQAILGFSPRLLAASFIAYLFGEFLNSFVLARLKVSTAVASTTSTTATASSPLDSRKNDSRPCAAWSSSANRTRGLRPCRWGIRSG